MQKSFTSAGPPAARGPGILRQRCHECIDGSTHFSGLVDHYLLKIQNLALTGVDKQWATGALTLMILRALSHVESLPVPTLDVSHLVQVLLSLLPLPNVLGQLHVILFGCMAQPMLLGVVDDLQFFVGTLITMKARRCNVHLCAARGLHLGAVHGKCRGSGGGLHATIGSSHHVECIEYMLVHQHGAKSTEIGSSGHVGCIKTNKYISWCTSRGPKMRKLADQDMWNASNKKTIDLDAPAWGQEKWNW